MTGLAILILSFMSGVGQFLIYDFKKSDDLLNWEIINDGVMGGLSKGTVSVNEDGHGVFSGNISLENNGGFSMARYSFQSLETKEYNKVVIRLRGDGKRYQFRIKANRRDRHSYVQHFQTSGEWQQIEIGLNDMYPTFRGQLLNMPNYPKVSMDEIAFLIANKKAESFRLEIDYIKLR